MRLLRMVGLAGVLVAAAGCIRGTLPPRELYRLAPPDSALRRAWNGDVEAAAGESAGAIVRPALDGSLGILAYEAPGVYGDGGIVYRVGDTEYGVYPSREWAIPLGEMLGTLTARLAATRALTRELPLYEPPSRRAQTYVWRATVREFEEVNRDAAVSVAVRLDATIVRTRDDSVMWAGSLGRERPVPRGQSMEAIVEALSVLAVDVVGELLARAERDLSGAVARVPADSAGRAP